MSGVVGDHGVANVRRRKASCTHASEVHRPFVRPSVRSLAHPPPIRSDHRVSSSLPSFPALPIMGRERKTGLVRNVLSRASFKGVRKRHSMASRPQKYRRCGTRVMRHDQYMTFKKNLSLFFVSFVFTTLIPDVFLPSFGEQKTRLSQYKPKQ